MTAVFSRIRPTPTQTIWAFILIAFAARLYTLLNHEGMWGVDGGAYLLSRNTALGDEPTHIDFPRPPLAPGWLLVPFTYLWGDNFGLRYFALFLSFVPLPAFILFAKQVFQGWRLVWLVGLFLADWQLTEMFIAGGLPMIGLAFILLIAWAFLKLKTGPDHRASILLTIALPVIVYTNQTSAGLSLIIIPALALGLGLDKAFLKRLAPPLLVGAALSLTALPWYLAVAPGSGLLRSPGPFLKFYSIANAGWYLLPLGLGVSLLARRSPVPLVRASAYVILPLALFAPLMSYDETVINLLYRGRYFMMPFLYICAMWIIQTRWKAFWSRFQVEWVMRPLLGGLVILTVPLGFLYQLHAESKICRMMTPETVEALEWITQQPGNGTIVTNSYSLSLFVAGMAKRKTAWTQVWDPPPAYARQHALALSLMGWNAATDPLEAAAELNASYVLVDTIWPAYDVEVAERVPGLGTLYSVLSLKLSPFPGDTLGFIYGAPGTDRGYVRPNDPILRFPWKLTYEATWLELVWEKGLTRVWKIRG